ncbi:MAG: TraB/GumN family protein [Ruminococcus sp.]|nr:TraB/GumN family protein [Ruminococcus sp.]
MKIKHILYTTAALILAIASVSCGNSSSSDAEESSSAVTTADATDAPETTSVNEAQTASPDDSEIDINDYITAKELTPAMWKATDPATGNHIFLMGTIHVAPEGELVFPDYVNEAYNNCEGVAVEYNVKELTGNMSVMQELLTSLVYTDGSTVKDHLSPEAYEAGVKALKELGLYNSMLDYYNVGFWTSEISSAAILDMKNLSSQGIDWQFIEKAEKDGKEIVNIETLQTQADAMAAYTDDYASYSICSSAETRPEELAEQLGEMYDCWASGDIDEFIDLEEPGDDLPEELLDDHAEYMKIMLFDRNKGMADAAESYINDGKNYLFMVGSLHFSGNKGIDDILSERGYTVERIG